MKPTDSGHSAADGPLDDVDGRREGGPLVLKGRGVEEERCCRQFFATFHFVLPGPGARPSSALSSSTKSPRSSKRR